MILIHNVVHEIIDVNSCTGIDDRLNLIQKLPKFQTIRQSDLVQVAIASKEGSWKITKGGTSNRFDNFFRRSFIIE